MPTLTSFKTKLLKPCKTLLRLLKLPYKKSFSIRALKSRKKEKTKKNKKNIFRSLVSVFRPTRRTRGEMDRLMELKSFTERDQQAPFPSPLTPAFVKLIGDRFLGGRGGGEEDVEEACRSFENYLVEMIVEEGKVKDLTDVEELLCCWDSLKCPVFVDLVSRFYGELCKDLFTAGTNYQYEVIDYTMYD